MSAPFIGALRSSTAGTARRGRGGRRPQVGAASLAGRRPRGWTMRARTSRAAGAATTSSSTWRRTSRCEQAGERAPPAGSRQPLRPRTLAAPPRPAWAQFGPAAGHANRCRSDCHEQRLHGSRPADQQLPSHDQPGRGRHDQREQRGPGRGVRERYADVHVREPPMGRAVHRQGQAEEPESQDAAAIGATRPANRFPPAP
jgi:hypothetical protein